MSLLNSKMVLIGAGNVATHLGLALIQKGFTIEQVYSRTKESARQLGNRLYVSYTDDLKQIRTDADIYIFSLKDSALPGLLTDLPPLNGLLVHTAGSLPLSVFRQSASKRHGVLYPLQTFSKDRAISFEEIPLFIEANNREDEYVLEELGAALSTKVVRLPSEKRYRLHLAAVFACNFVNYMYANAAEILEKEGLPEHYLLPLIEETASKIKSLPPREAQTGPAVRYDTNIIDKHLELLNDDPEKEALYREITRRIYRMCHR